MIVADTDVLIDFLGGHNPAAQWVRGKLEEGTVATTVISRFELMCGAKIIRQRELIYTFLNALSTLTLDPTAADLAARLRQSLQTKGWNIGMADSLIAGITIANNGVLLTRNRRHFERIEGMHLADMK